MAPANVLQGAVRLHGLASSPTPETQVRQDILAVTNVWVSPALPNSSSPPKVRRETIAELCHLRKGVHGGLRRAVDEIAQEGMRAPTFAPADSARPEMPRFAIRASGFGRNC